MATKVNKNIYEKCAKISMGIVLTIVFFALTLYIVKFGFPFPLVTTGSIEQWGSFGDFIGGLINPLLQLIVITMLLWSIQVQRKELAISNETLKATQQELKETKESSKKQADELASQTLLLKEQQQSSSNNIKLDQQVKLLNQQQDRIESFFDTIALAARDYTIIDLMRLPNLVPLTAKNAFNRPNCYEWTIAEDVEFLLRHNLMVLVDFLECTEIPIVFLNLKLEWFYSNMRKLVACGILKQAIVDKYIENININILKCSLSIENKEFFVTSLVNKYFPHINE